MANLRMYSFAVAVFLLSGCGASSAVPERNETTAVSEPAKLGTDPALSRADALIEDLQKRQAGYQVLVDNEKEMQARRLSMIPVIVEPGLPAASSPAIQTAAQTPPNTAGDSVPMGDLDRMKAQARRTFAPTFVRLGGAIDQLNDTRARYLQLCSGSTRVTTKGTNEGSGTVSADGVVATRDNAALWTADGTFGWKENWTATSEIRDKDTAICRQLQGEIRWRSTEIRNELSEVEIAAQQLGIYPGVIRDLRAQYGLPQ